VPAGKAFAEAGAAVVLADVNEDNGNKGRASPVHHEHRVWRPSTGSRIDAKPYG
jgi:hypothetical protein